MIRLMKAFKYSCEGLYAAIKFEVAFRQECIVLLMLTIAAFFFTQSTSERLLLIGSWIFVLIIELINSGLECLCDEVTQEIKPKIKKAKDYGSAAVLLSIILCLFVWIAVLAPRLYD